MSVHPHEGKEVTRFITYTSQKLGVGWGGRWLAMSQGKGHPLPQVPSRESLDSRVANTYYL